MGTILSETDMVRITLVPDTSHCIETVAKMEYRELMHSCLRTGTADADSAEKMKLLHDSQLVNICSGYKKIAASSVLKNIMEAKGAGISLSFHSPHTRPHWGVPDDGMRHASPTCSYRRGILFFQTTR